MKKFYFFCLVILLGFVGCKDEEPLTKSTIDNIDDPLKWEYAYKDSVRKDYNNIYHFIYSFSFTTDVYIGNYKFTTPDTRETIEEYYDTPKLVIKNHVVYFSPKRNGIEFKLKGLYTFTLSGWVNASNQEKFTIEKQIEVK